MKLTKEQEEIINSEDKNLSILAKAGTGKTTTLIEFARRRPKKIFLYLVYNKSNRLSSLKKFFGNTEVHTIHSLAYKEIGYLYEDKLSNSLNLENIINGIDSLKKEDRDNQELYIKAGIILSSLDLFLSSSKEIDEIYCEYKEELIEYWNNMININRTDVKMTHDGYLKLYQLSNPILDYDYIMVDEAQDSNEVMLDIVMNQSCNKIFVGDEDQEIYSFRNSHNVFKNDLFNDFKKFYLRKSFRFGECIAWFANKLLNHYKEENIEVIGSEHLDEIVLESIDENKTIITRTNAHLFDLCVISLKENKRIHIIGDNFVFNEIEDVYNLYKGNLYKIKNPYIKKYGSYFRMKKINEKIKDLEITFIIKIIDKYLDEIPFLISEIKKNLTSLKKAEITFSTAHKSKGLEFDNVELAEDFFSLFTKNRNLKKNEEIPYEEINLYYVSITRAKLKLKLNRELFMFLSI